MRNITSGLIMFAMVAGAPVMAETATAPTSKPAKTAKKSDDERIRCRSQLETGSLTRYRKTCMTIAEWRKYNDHGNRQARALVDMGNACGAGAGCRDGLEP